MPRTLPWLADAGKTKEKSKAKSSTPASKRKRDSSPEDLVDSDLNAIGDVTPEKKPRRRPNRTPSTSPPPAPPDLEYMREGYNADDIYMMVEDEFLSKAKMFTQHIHHAEYVRLKKLAKSREAGALQAITRATDGRTGQSNSLKLKLEAEGNGKQTRAAMKNLEDGESSEAEDAYMQDPQLAGLMTRENQGRKDLSGFIKVRSNTRAAAGFSQSPRNVERKRDALANIEDTKPIATSSKTGKVFREELFSHDNEDDLDAAPSKPIRPTYAKAEKRQRATNGNTEKEKQDETENFAKSSRIFKRFAEPAKDGRREEQVTFASPERARVSGNKKAAPSPSSNDETTTRNAQSTAAREYLAKRKADKEKKEREEKREAKKADDIPTFLF